MKQTAVEWLIKEYSKYVDDSNVPFKVIQQAKAMEKEQMMYAYNSDRDLLSCYDDGSAFHEYYNETYL
jgi:hypothetical protein